MAVLVKRLLDVGVRFVVIGGQIMLRADLPPPSESFNSITTIKEK